MNDSEQKLFEAELRRLTPASPPAELMAKLGAARIQSSVAELPRPSTLSSQPFWQLLLRWLVPAAAVGALAVTLLVWRPFSPKTQQRADVPVAQDKPALKADDVEIDQRLVASFDAIARLPNGLPVRLRCREWADEVVLRDTARGIVVEQRAPRLEVVPVSFETY